MVDIEKLCSQLAEFYSNASDEEFKLFHSLLGIHQGKSISEQYPDHFTTLMRLDGKEVEIDIRIADLIILLNEKNFKTTFCCEGYPLTSERDAHGSKAYVSFLRGTPVEVLINLPWAARYDWDIVKITRFITLSFPHEAIPLFTKNIREFI
jgi:hypothetical protein